MKGFGTDETTIISILTSRHAWQIDQITEAFSKEYGETLVSRIEKECSGDLKRFLVGLGKAFISNDRRVNLKPVSIYSSLKVSILDPTAKGCC